MSLHSTTRDTRRFRAYVKVLPDGTIGATTYFAAGTSNPIDGEQSLYVDVTDLHPFDFTDVVVAIPVPVVDIGLQKPPTPDGEPAPTPDPVPFDPRPELFESLKAANTVSRV